MRDGGGSFKTLSPATILGLNRVLMPFLTRPTAAPIRTRASWLRPRLLGCSLFAILFGLAGNSDGSASEHPELLTMERLPGEGVWISPWPEKLPKDAEWLRVTVWFESQFLGDGKGYRRRAEEFGKVGRRELREGTIRSLKKQSEESFGAVREELAALEKKGLCSHIERHWIVNGFSCHLKPKDVAELEKLKGVRKVFLRPVPELRRKQAELMPALVKMKPLQAPVAKNLPWYTEKLNAQKVWQEFGLAGKGVLNVIHDKNFIISEGLVRGVYWRAGEVPGNGIDDDGNGYIDDQHGYNFDRQSGELYTQTFSGDPKDRKVLHGTSCANIICGSGAGEEGGAFGLAPLSQWAGVINQGGIEQSVEWAIEQGADTYSMSFSRRHYGEYRSHWRKVMEQGNFCGLYFVSGAGNIARNEEFPFLMNIPQSIPEAVFAAAGVQQDLSKTEFSCVGPVEWNNEHYQDGVVQKPEVCAFNSAVVGELPDGRVIPGLLYGNSYAGPMFCGTIALMLSADPDLLPWDLKEIITATARDVGPEGVDNETGYGLIDCHAAVKEVLRRKADKAGG